MEPNRNRHPGSNRKCDGGLVYQDSFRAGDFTVCGMPLSRAFVYLVGAARFELATPCAQGRCATRLRYAPTLIDLECE